MSEKAKEILKARMDAVSDLIERYPLYIPVIAAAEFLHVGAEALRASIEQGKCPFGICWRLGDRMAYKLPTLTFVCWVTCSPTVPV